MRLTFNASDIQADEGRRLISGKILPFENEIGQTNVGKVVFKAGSVQWDDPKKVKFLLEHSAQKPLGRATSIMEEKDGLYATFRVSNTTRGSDALVEASEELRSGLSVGVEVLDSKQNGNVLEVLSARLEEVSLVSSPAFKSAEVLEVAASESEEVEVEQPNNESEAPVENTPEVVAPEAEVTPAVEASRPTVTAMAYTKPRIEVTKRNYLANFLKASVLDDDDAKVWIKAADNETTTAPGMIPTPQSSDVLNFLSNADRPLIDSISRGTMPAFGKTFEIPKISAVPTVDQIDENQAIADSQLTASYIVVDKKSFKGRMISTIELIDQSNPAFLDEALRQLEFAYAKDTEQYVTGEIANAGTLNATGRANDATGLLSYVSSAAAAIYSASLGFARSIVVTPEQWANIMAYNDGGRPIYIASNPQNAAGVLRPDAVTGTVAGLTLRVSRYIVGAGGDNTADYSMVVVNPDAYTWYESGRQQLRTNVNSDGTVDILLYGYGALATKLAAGANWFNKS
jgi:HK97 family phage prohead protease